MANASQSSAEPFVDRVALPNGRFFRVGYRAEGLDDILAVVEVPVHVLEDEIASGLELVIQVSPSGEVVSQIVASSGLDLLRPRTSVPINHLILETVGANSLRLEEASTSELRTLLRSLELSVEHVRTALAKTCAEA